MKISSILLSAAAAMSLAVGATHAAHADDVLVAALNKGTSVNTTPQVAYPPICRHDPLFPRYCRRW